MGKRFAAPLVAIAVVALITVRPIAAYASDEGSFISKINAERSSRGLRTLTVEDDLTAVARRHSQRMASDDRIYHNDNLGSDVRGWWTIGENVGRGRTVTKIHDAFMASSYHAQNILSGKMNQLGVGVAYGEDGKIYVTQIFVERDAPRGGGGGGGGGGDGGGSGPTATYSTSSSSGGTAEKVAARPKPEPESIAVEMLLHVVRLDSR